MEQNLHSLVKLSKLCSTFFKFIFYLKKTTVSIIPTFVSLSMFSCIYSDFLYASHLQKACDVNSQSYSGNTALHSACGRGQVDTVRMLLKSGADSSLKNYHNDTPVMVAKNKKVSDKKTVKPSGDFILSVLFVLSYGCERLHQIASMKL